MRGLLALLLAVLAACGGGAAGPVALVVQQATPAPSAPAVQAPASAAEPAESAPSAAAASWVQVWREDWPSLRLAGWVSSDTGSCTAGSEADPGTASSFGAWTKPDAWASVGYPSGAATIGQALAIDDTQTVQGWALLSGTTFDHTRGIRLTGVVELQPDGGSWLGLTLHHGEGDYRELSIYEDGGRLRLGTWAPCFIRWALADVPAGPRALAIEYTPPPASICWRYYLDAVLVLAERCDDRGAQLDGPPRVGVFAVNLRAEAMHLTSRLRETVGPLSVWQAATP